MSEGLQGGEVKGVPSPFDQLMNRLFGNRFAEVVSWSLFALGALLVLLRVSLLLVSSLDSVANGWLEKRLGAEINAEITGLHGSWNGLAPQLSIDRFEFAYGTIEELRFDLDVFGSLRALTPKVSAVEVGKARLSFPRDFNLFDHLLNARSNLDLLALASHLKFLAIRAHIGVRDDAESLELKWLGHAHERSRGVVQLFSPGESADEGLVLGYDLDMGSVLRNREGAVWGSGGVQIPASWKSLLGVSGELSTFDLNLQLDGSGMVAFAVLRAEELEIGDFQMDEAEFEVKGRGELLAFSGELPMARFSRGDSAIDLTGTRFTLEDLRRWYFRLPDQQIESLTGFIVESAIKETAAVRWSERFAPAGLLSSISGLFDARGPLTLSAEMSDFSAQSFNGSPSLDSVAGRLIYTSGGARILVDTASATMSLPKLFDAPVMLGPTTGELWVRFFPAYVGMRGIDLRADLPRGGGIEVDLSYSAPADPFERQISGVVHATRIPATDALQFVPIALPHGMRDWLRAGVLGGVIQESDLFLSGYVRRQSPLPTMQVEMTLDVREGTFMYHSSWPVASAITGQLELAGGMLRGRVKEARMLEKPFQDVLVSMPLKGTEVQLEDAGEVGADFLAQLTHFTPLGKLLSGASTSVTAGGPVQYEFKMGMPVAFNFSDLEIESSFAFDDVALGFSFAKSKDLLLEVEKLNGALEFDFPLRLESHGLQGLLFSRPAVFEITSLDLPEGGATPIQTRIESELAAETLQGWFASALEAEGLTPFKALVEFNHALGVPLRFQFESDLRGMELTLPADLGKVADEPVPTTLDVTLQTGFDSGEASFSLAERLSGELGWKDYSSKDSNARGSIHVGAGSRSQPASEDAPDRIVFSGRLPSVSLTELRNLTSATGGIPLPKLQFADLEVGLLDLGRFALHDLVLTGVWDSQAADLKLESDQAQGTWRRAAGGVSQLEFDWIHLLPRDEQDRVRAGDLLVDLDVRTLPQADVSLASLKIAEADYGAWKFQLRHLANGVRFVGLEADARDLSIRAPDGVHWHQSKDGAYRSEFIGELASDDLGNAMEQWGFAPSVEAERAQLITDLSWPGPPWKPRLEALEGDIDLTIRRGRFRDIDATASMKLLSLLDFNAFIRRLALDFSDVFGDGVAFDEVRVKSRFADGTMSMIEPVKIDGNGSRFRIDGSINLETGELDTQLEATLKISRSLPWLGAYMALLGNPITGLGTALVERIFRNPLERLSTARYDVTGTLSEPIFTLSGVEPPEPLIEQLFSEEEEVSP